MRPYIGQAVWCSRQVSWDSPNTDLRSKISSVKLYALIHPNLYQFQGHPCFRLNQCVKSPTPPESLRYNHPQNVLVNAEQHTLRTHTWLKSFSQTYTAIQGSNSERIGAAATHYRGGSCFDWARSEAGRKLDPLHWSWLGLLYSFSLCLSLSASTITQAALYKLMTSIRTDSTVTSNQ